MLIRVVKTEIPVAEGENIEASTEDSWRDRYLLRRAVGCCARLRFRAEGLLAVRSIFVLQGARALASRRACHDSSHRLVVYGSSSTDQDSDADPVSAASLGDDLVRCL